MQVKNKRILALLIDLLIIGLCSSVVTGFFMVEGKLAQLEQFNHTITIRWSFSFLFYLVYFFAFDIFGNSVTLGKKALGILTLSEKNEDISFKFRMYRTILKTLSILFWPISAMVYLLSGKTLQDTLCRTRTTERQEAPTIF